MGQTFDNQIGKWGLQMPVGSICWCNLWLISQQGLEFQPPGFESLERQKRGTKLINVAPKFRGLQQRKRSGQIRRKPNRRRKNNGKKNKKRGTRVISKGLVKHFISFLNHSFFRIICQYFFQAQNQKEGGKIMEKRTKNEVLVDYHTHSIINPLLIRDCSWILTKHKPEF